MPTFKSNEEEELGAEGTIGSAAPAAQMQAAGQTPVATAEPKGSGMFTNLNKFVEANKDKSGEFAGGVAGGLKSKGEGIVSEIGTGAEASKATMKTPTYTAGSLTADSSIEDIDAAADAGTVTQAETDIYNTPFANATLENRAKETAKTMAGTETQAGLGVVTQDYYKDKGIGATRGEAGFDTMLLGRDTVAKDVFKDLRDKVATPLSTAYETATKGVSDFGAKQAAEAARIAGLVKSDAGTAIAGLQGAGLTSATSRASTGADEALAEINRRLAPYGGPPLTMEQAAKFINTPTPTWEAGLTEDQVAKYNALARLSGGTGITYTAPTSSSINEGALSEQLSAAESASMQAKDDARKNAANGVVDLPPDATGVDVSNAERTLNNTTTNKITVTGDKVTTPGLINLRPFVDMLPQGAVVTGIDMAGAPISYLAPGYQYGIDRIGEYVAGPDGNRVYSRDAAATPKNTSTVSSGGVEKAPVFIPQAAGVEGQQAWKNMMSKWRR